MSSQWLILVVCIAVVQIGWTSAAGSRSKTGAIDTSFYYRLTNDFLGSELALDVKNDGRDYPLKMASIDDRSGQFWRFIPLDNGAYKMQTEFLKNAYSLDIVNNENDRDDRLPHMAKTGSHTGQRWHLQREPEGTFRLFNDFTGNEHFLDVTDNAARPLMNVDIEGEKDPGQHWTLTKIRRI